MLEPWYTYDGEYRKEIRYSGECSCLYRSCTPRYYNIVDLDRGFMYVVRICNEFIRLKIREKYINSRNTIGVSSTFVEITENSFIQKDLVMKYHDELLSDILIDEFHISHNRPYTYYKRSRSLDLNVRTFINKKHGIEKHYNISNAIDIFLNKDIQHCVKSESDIQAGIYQYFQTNLHHVLSYAKYKRHHKEAEKMLNSLNPYHSDSQKKDVYINAIQLLFELKILEHAKSS